MTHTYNVAGITCDGCVASVKSRLLKIADVLSADVRQSAPQATVTMARHIPTIALQEALSGTKYSITEATSDMSTTAQAAATDAAKTSYYPIYLIFGYIAGASLLVHIGRHPFPYMQWMSSFMAGFFLVFSFFKLLNLSAFKDGYSTYDIVAKVIPAYGYVYPFIELALGIAFLTGFHPLFTNIATFVVMGVSTIGVVRSLIKKQVIQCACLGTIIQLPLSKVTLYEDLVMVIMSAVMIILNLV